MPMNHYYFNKYLEGTLSENMSFIFNYNLKLVDSHFKKYLESQFKFQ